MPGPGRAWLTTDAGQVFAGTLSVGCDGDPQKDCWSWKLEAYVSTLTKGRGGNPLQLNAIAIDSSGRGLAVGSEGLILQRDADGSWQRLNTGRLDTFYSVALPPSGYGDGALIGGGVGLVLTRVGGRFEIARPADFFAGLNNGRGNFEPTRIVGVAVLPGYKPGEVEAWAASQMPTQDIRPGSWPGAILHYTNAPSGSLLDADAGRVHALPDASTPQDGEVSFAAFGKQECQLSGEPTCPEMQGSNLVNEVIARRVTDAIADTSKGSDGPAFAVFTGDVGNSAGRDQGVENPYGGVSAALNAPVDTDVIHHRWSELVVQPLQNAGVALFGALGDQDLSQTGACTYLTGCEGTRQVGNPGDSLPWREAFAGMPAPWGAPGSRPPPAAHGLSFVAVGASGVEGPSQSVSSQSVAAGGAHTHYAFDVERDGEKRLRVVFVDSSLKTLAGAATQNPVEEQLKWLTDVLSSRPSGERAIVVSETPSYSPGPGATTDVLTDSAAFEALMGREGVSAVVSGRVGWNGLYYTSTLAPGLHCPQQGGSYPDPACDPTLGASGASVEV
jgi:hypothetical protein